MEVSRMHGVKHVVLCAHDNTLEEWALVGRAWSRVGVREIHTCVFAVEEALQIVKQRVRAREQVAKRLQVIGMVQQSRALPLPDTRHTRIFPDTSQLHTNQQLILGDIFARTKVWRADERARIDLASVPPRAHSHPL
jgi:hypothetical protein